MNIILKAHCSDGEIFNLKADVEKIEDSLGLTLKVSATNQENIAIKIKFIELFEMDLCTTHIKFFRMGAYMPSDTCGIFSLNAKTIVPEQGFFELDYQLSPYEFLSHGLSFIQKPDGTRLSLYGVMGGQKFQTYFIADTSKDTIMFSCVVNTEGIILEPGEQIEMEELLVLYGDDVNELLDVYSTRLANAHEVRMPKKVVSGWSDWQYYREEKSEGDIYANLGSLKTLNASGVEAEYVVIDGGFCHNLSEWSKPGKNFPAGMKDLSEKIKQNGMNFGIWFAPYVTNVDTQVVKDHPDWFVIDKRSGKYLSEKDSCVGEYYVIDYSIPETLEWLRSIVRMMIKEWDIKYLKLDGPSPDKYLHGELKDRNMTIPMMFKNTLEAISEECGRQIIIEGEGLYYPSIGYVDIQRVQQDNHVFWTRPQDGRSAMKENMKNDLLSSFLHKKVWHNHRENVILRDFPSPYHHTQQVIKGSREQVISEQHLQFQISAQAMSGGAMLLTDPMVTLMRNPNKLKLIHQIYPVYDHSSCKMHQAFDDGFAPAWYSVKTNNSSEEWITLALFNWDDVYRNYRFSLLDLAEKASWHVHEFWEQKYLGIFQDELVVEDVPPQSARLYALRKADASPKFLGGNIHLFQGAVEIQEQCHEEDGLRLIINHSLQDDVRMTIYKPKHKRLNNIETSASDYLIDDRKEDHYIIHYNSRGETSFELSFTNE